MPTRRSASGPAIPGALEGRHARRRHHQLRRQDQLPRLRGNLHLVERFTRIGDNTLLYEFTVDDPTTWSAEFPIAKNEALIYEYACHEGNYGMTNLLRGARFQEREALIGSR